MHGWSSALRETGGAPGQFADELREKRGLPINEDGKVKPRQAVWKRFCNGCGTVAAAV